MASEVKADKLSPSTGTALQLGDASDTITVPTGATFTITDGLGVGGGGTGLTSLTAGDILYATGTTTLAKLAKGSAEQVLAMNSGATAPDWGSVDLTVLPTITAAKGGTGQTSYTTGDTVYASGSTAVSKLNIGTARQALQTNAGATAPEWVNSPQSLMTAEGDILYASGANTLAKLAKGSDDEVLTLASGVPSWAEAGGGASAVVASGTITGSPSEIIEDGCFTSSYKFYELFIADLHSTSSTSIHLQMRNGGSTVTGSNYRGINTHVYFTTGSYATNMQGQYDTSTGWNIHGDSGIYNHVVSALVGKVFFPWGDNISTYNKIMWKTWAQQTSTTGQMDYQNGTGIYNGYQVYDGFRLYFGAGTIAEGEYTVIGYKS